MRFHSLMDTRRWGPGERLVFEPYTREAFEDSFRWIEERRIFDGGIETRVYDQSIVTLS